MNVNVLLGWKCPECGQTEDFEVAARCWVRLSDDGTEDADSFEWSDTDAAICRGCDYTGQVGHFKEEG